MTDIFALPRAEENFRLNQGSTERCIICTNLAVVAFGGCNHRFYCVACYRLAKDRSPRRIVMCPNRCSRPANCHPDYDASSIQHLPLTINDTDDVDPQQTFSPVTYPYGYCILREADLIGTPSSEEDRNYLNSVHYKEIRRRYIELLHNILNDAGNQERLNDAARAFAAQGIEQLLRARLDGNIPTELYMKLFSRLNREDSEAIMSELMAKVDLHQAVVKYTAKEGHLSWVDRHARSLMRDFFIRDDLYAYCGRAAAAGVFDAGSAVLSRTFGFNISGAGMCLGNILAFGCLVGAELYQYSTNREHTYEITSINIGEHLLGCCAGIVGGLIGAALFGPVIGAVLGDIVGGFVMDMFARTAYRGVINENLRRQRERAERAMLQEAASSFGVHLSRDTYAAAKAKYRTIILRYHSDRCPANATEEERKQWSERTAKYITHWNIVRAHYVNNRLVAPNTVDAFARIYILQVQQAANQMWKTVRAWFTEDNDNFPVGLQGPQTRVVEKLIYY